MLLDGLCRRGPQVEGEHPGAMRLIHNCFRTPLPSGFLGFMFFLPLPQNFSRYFASQALISTSLFPDPSIQRFLICSNAMRKCSRASSINSSFVQDEDKEGSILLISSSFSEGNLFRNSSYVMHYKSTRRRVTQTGHISVQNLVGK